MSLTPQRWNVNPLSGEKFRSGSISRRSESAPQPVRWVEAARYTIGPAGLAVFCEAPLVCPSCCWGTAGMGASPVAPIDGAERPLWVAMGQRSARFERQLQVG